MSVAIPQEPPDVIQVSLQEKDLVLLHLVYLAFDCLHASEVESYTEATKGPEITNICWSTHPTAFKITGNKINPKTNNAIGSGGGWNEPTRGKRRDMIKTLLNKKHYKEPEICAMFLSAFYTFTLT